MTTWNTFWANSVRTFPLVLAFSLVLGLWFFSFSLTYGEDLSINCGWVKFSVRHIMVKGRVRFGAGLYKRR